MRDARHHMVQSDLADCLEVPHPPTEECRDPSADRVVIVKWKLDPPCEAPTEAEDTPVDNDG